MNFSLKGKSIRYVLSFVVGVAWACFQFYTSLFGELSTIPQRATHLCFALTLLFLVRPIQAKWAKKFPWLEWLLTAICIAGVVIPCLYLTFNDVEIASHLGIIYPMEIAFGVVVTILVLEGTRRTVGLALPIVACVFLLYAFFGHLVPGTLGHRPFAFSRLVSVFYLETEGVFGIVLGVSASFLFMFLMFAAFLKESGGGELFTSFASAIAGKSRGGPAKVAIIGSGLFGSISGSSVANIASVGTLTIPLMKRVGYSSTYAAGVEAVASTGGVLMPPVMGAAAFVMAEMLSVPYSTVAFAAMIPAILYYFSLFTQVHLEACKKNLTGLSKDELPSLRAVMKENGHLGIPLIALVVLMCNMPDSAGMVGAISTILVVVIAALKKNTRMGFVKIMNTLFVAAKGALDVAMTCACVGVIIGVVGITGLGNKLAGTIGALANGNLTLLLLFSAICSIILGMGLPITPAYLILVVIVGPLMQDCGLPAITAHMFMLYFGAISFITPPVAISAYAAAGVAGCNAFRTGFTAMRMGIAGFLVPFAFAYDPALMLQGSALDSAIIIPIAIIGIMVLAMGIEGYAFRNLRIWERVIYIASSLLIIYPERLTSVIGLAVAAVFVVPQIIKALHNRAKKSLPQTESA